MQSCMLTHHLSGVPDLKKKEKEKTDPKKPPKDPNPQRAVYH